MSLLKWFAEDTLRYFAPSQTLLFGFVILTAVGAFSGPVARLLDTRRGTIAYLCFAFVVLVAARWPTFFVVHQLNVDEAQMVAQAISIPFDPIPWRGFDGLTSGPLNSYVLVVPHLFGGTATFLSARVTALVLEFAAVVALYLAITTYAESSFARLSVLAPVSFWSVTVQNDFLHYSSEHLSLFLTASMFAAIAVALRRNCSNALVFFAGLCDGALPFAKLQAVPLAIAGFLLAAGFVAGSSAKPGWARARCIGVLTAGAAVVPTLLIAAIAYAGSFDDFRRSYIETSLAYVISQDDLYGFLFGVPDFGYYFGFLTAVSVVTFVRSLLTANRIPVAIRNFSFASIAILVASIIAIAAPGRHSAHYLHFGVLPAAAAATAGLASACASLAPHLRASRQAGLSLGFVAAVVLVLGLLWRQPYDWVKTEFYFYAAGMPYDPLSAQLERNLRPDERLAIWGWCPQYFVLPQLRLGTRDSAAVFTYITRFNPNRDYFRERYVADFVRNEPEGFLDCGPESWDVSGGTSGRFEEFEQLSRVVNHGYILKSRWKRFRLYLRRDVAAARPD